jgi:signal transduction histidine kinase
VLGARSEAAPVVADLRFSMARLYGDRGLDVHVLGLEGLCFQGDAQDLTEMVGNLLDNACKWAKSAVWIEGRREADTLVIRIEDDGPGVPEERLADVLERGVRLDERSSGAGLGLDIVRDIADLYGGSLTLERSPRGGLRADLELPAAP